MAPFRLEECMEPRKVLVVEDDPMTRGLLADILDAAGYVVATASTGADARRLCTVVDPDAVVMDIDLGVGPTGFDVADALLSEHPHLVFLFLTNLPDPRFAGRNAEDLPAGAAYLRKERLSEVGLLARTIEQVLRGDRVRTRDDLDPNRPLGTLSQTQIEVLRMVALGMSNQQIANARNTSVRAVESLLSRIMQIIDVDETGRGNARVVAARNFIQAAGLPLAD